jgi:xanthine dehydrogenase accessory factor
MEPDIYEAIVEARRKGQRIALATIVARKGSTPRRDPAKMVIYDDGRQIGTVGGGCAEAEICREALSAIRSEKSKLLKFDLTDDDIEESGLICGGTMEVYVEPILPDPSLFVFGAGHVGRCIAGLARGIGFKVCVVDDRVKYANRERFPEADSLYVDAWENVFPQLPITDSSYLVIVTRGHQYDLVCLRFALRSPARYIGLLGSKRKIGVFFGKLESEGIQRSQFSRVFAPVGIEIGSETPEEIAVSVVAELIAVRKNLPVGLMKEALRDAACRREPASGDQPSS